MIPTILHEDDAMVVVDKPAGMVVHPTYRNVSGTLLDLLRSAIHWRDDESPSIVGRLDRLTSGIVIVAKTPLAHAALQRAMASDDCTKLYRAIVDAGVDAREGVIDLALAIDPGDRRRVRVSADGAPSVTRFECFARGAGRSLLYCRPLTGRRHQIRAHLAARGWPVTGDAVYGTALPGFPRHALHAWRVAMVHPFTGDRHRFEASVPDDLEALLVRG